MERSPLCYIEKDPRSWNWKKGVNDWDTYYGYPNKVWIQSTYVNKKTIYKYSEWLNKLDASDKLIYSAELSSCVTHTSIALNMSGIFNIGIHPYLLHSQVYLWNNGVRPWSFISYLKSSVHDM